MPEDSSGAKSPAGNDDDDIRKRFTVIERDGSAVSAHDDLPPVPEIKIDRPGQKPAGLGASATSGASFSSADSKMPRVRGMYGGGEMRSSGQALTIGTSLVGSIIVGTGLGWLVDKYLLHSTGTPWGLICGFMLGVASGFVQLVRVANQLNKD